MKTNSQDLVTQAEQLGYAAAERGLTPRAPALDVAFGELLNKTGATNGESLPWLVAWHKGYQRQCDEVAAAILAA